MSQPTIVNSRLRGTPAQCPSCEAELDFERPHSYDGQLQVRCARCTFVFPYSPAGSSSKAGNSSSSKPAAAGVSTGPGSDENPKETIYYETLGIGPQATPDEIKKAYRKMAIKLHPDKNRNDPDADAKFQELSIAYQVLSDPNLRHIYNVHGQKKGGGGVEPPGGFQDPDIVLGMMFGGERFRDLVGDISIGKDMKEAMEMEQEEATLQASSGPRAVDAKGKPIFTAEEIARKQARQKAFQEKKAASRKTRVDKLVMNLVNKVSIFAESAKGEGDRVVTKSFREIARLEAEELVKESYGWELLQAIGKTYIAKAEQFEASSSFAPLGWFHSAKQNFNLVGDTVSTLRAALELKAVFDKLQAAEQSGLSPENIRKLEEQAAEQGMRTLWKGAKLEVESVIRETCDKALNDSSISEQKRQLRAVALKMIGEAFVAQPKEGEEAPPEKGPAPPPSSGYPREKSAPPPSSNYPRPPPSYSKPDLPPRP